MSESRDAQQFGLPHLGERQPLLLKRALLAYAAAIVIAGWSYEYWQVQNDRRATLDASRNQLTAIATAFGTQVTAMINDGVGAAEAAANEIRARGATYRLSTQEKSNVLNRMLTGGDYVREVFLVTSTTFVEATRSDLVGSSARPSWADEIIATKDRDTWVGHALNVEMGDAKITIPIARRVSNEGDPGEWSGALFGVDSLDRMYRALPIDQGAVSLITTSGEVLMRVPTEAGLNFVGRNISASDAFRQAIAAGSSLALVDASNPITGEPRLFAARRVESYPLFAVAGRSVEVALAPWRERTRRSLEMAIAGTLALMIVTVALYLLLNARYEVLRRSEERFLLAAAGSNAGIWDWDMATNHVYYSPRIKQQLGVDDIALGTDPDSFWQRMHPDDARPAKWAVQRHILHRDPYDVEYRMLVRGEYRWFHAGAQAVWDKEGNALRMAGSISDIHERKLAEQSLLDARTREIHVREEFAQHLLLAQEQERLRLANELHDSVGQNLSLIKNRALLALREPDIVDSVRHHVVALSDLTSEVITEVRTVAQNLRPLHIEQLGLTDALQSLVDKVKESGAIGMECRLENVDDVLTGAAATHLFRIAQEALNNILKHAQAKQCRVWLERDLHYVRLTISDDGVGFDTDADSERHGLGLASFAERVRMLSGTIRIESKTALLDVQPSNQGTTVWIEIPVTESTSPNLRDSMTDFTAMHS